MPSGLSPPKASSSHSRSSSESQTIPVEIFYHILENVPRNSLTSVARANTSLNEVSEKLIYRHLELTTIPQALRCFQTLQEKPSAAQSVREFVIMINGPRNHVVDFGPLLNSALRSLTHLTALHLAIEGPYASSLDKCTFPRLTAFSSIVDLSPDWLPMADFLNRHPTIINLCIGGESPGQSFALAPSALPALQAYMGSRRLAPAIVPRRPVSRITLAWHAPNVELEVGCIVPFLAMSSVTTQSFSCATPGWSSVLIRAIATYLPKLQSIRLHNISTDYHNEAEAFTTLTEILSSFTNLTRLELPCHKNIRSILSQNDEAHVAKTWQGGAPRLQTILFPSSRTWRRMASGSWALM
ncbi:hypothetical protein DFH11DRAFT_704260 [Phellopilus nigrolimitatus]|nr:hypothetical protein DFH11DRAFT_704260 [Phellopilus nigrolimitatus]